MSASAPVDETVIAILGDVLGTPPHSLGADAVLAAHGWDSLASLEALAQLESHFAISLDLRSFHAAHTVAQMVALVENAIAVKTRVP